ncbi:MAG: penicillin-binding transpeptidase domain-containing protein, partial [Candidatus Gracilibacteria bacterium]|nr:penicillin-binding transpeptidase domain-containing protein [Candidatus Gracilibacteria bacterium]
MKKQKQTKNISEKLITRVNFLRLAALVMTILIGTKLFYLQILRHDHYQEIADNQHKSHVSLPAKRGTVYLNDGQNGEAAVLATDVSLDLIYIDPGLISESDHELIAGVLAEMLFEEEEESTEYDFYDEVANNALDIFLSSEDFLTSSGEVLEVPPEIAEPEVIDTVLETREKKVEAYKAELIKRMSRKEVNYVRLLENPSEELAQQVEDLHLRGVFVVTEEIYADPTLIQDNTETAEKLFELLGIPKDELAYRLRPRAIHYLPIKNRIDPQKTEQILRALEQKYILLGDKIFPSEAETFDLLKRRLILKGLGVTAEHHRYYPENQLASQIIGFVNKEGDGQYGLEGQFDKEYNGITLRGKAGRLLFDRDASGKQIAVGDKVLDPAIPGDTIYLTINRAIQEFVETQLEKQIKEYDAERGEVIVIEVETGAILAMATYPTFDPNIYEDAFDKYEEGIHAGEYKNKIGPKAFQNPSLSDVYEPGSVFKIITMASGLDVGEVEPKTVHCEYSSYELRDGYRIWN